MIDRSIGIAGLALSIFSMVVPVMCPNLSRRWASGGFVVGLFLLGAAAMMFILPVNTQQNVPAVNGNCNALGNNNSNCSQYINEVPQKLRFTDAIGAALLAKIPKDKLLNIDILGGGSDEQVGLDIFAFLQRNGYHTDVSIIGESEMPDQQLTYNAKQNLLVIAAAAINR